MISICIPIYNFHVTPTVKEIQRQAQKAKVLYEIILMDDASEESFRVVNSKLNNEVIRYIQLNENIGRSKIRNKLAKEAQFDYLLFLDCDVMIHQSAFISNYTDYITAHKPDVICGGRVYEEIPPTKDRLLRWTYGRDRESASAEERREFPNRSFMTNNFVIRRSIIENCPFDESLFGYGHEDTLLGFQLAKNGVQIDHLENPVLNGDLEDNDTFLEKTEEGILNLIRIYKSIDDPEFAKSIKLLDSYQTLKKRGVIGAVRLQHIVSGSTVKAQLSKGSSNMQLFNLYKLGYFVFHLSKIKV